MGRTSREEESFDGGALRLRATLTHAHVGVNGPDGPNAVTIDYRAVLDGDRTIGIADGAVRRHALTLARRIHFGVASRSIETRARTTTA